jgi:hypothetical protein
VQCCGVQRKEKKKENQEVESKPEANGACIQWYGPCKLPSNPTMVRLSFKIQKHGMIMLNEDTDETKDHPREESKRS